MSADFVLYAITPQEYPEWYRLEQIEIFGVEAVVEREMYLAKYGIVAGKNADSRAQGRMIRRFHDEGRACQIAEVSFLKASLLNDGERYVPDVVTRISAVLDQYRGKVLDRTYAAAVIAAMSDCPNRSIFQDTAELTEVAAWLDAHLGFYLSSMAE